MNIEKIIIFEKNKLMLNPNVIQLRGTVFIPNTIGYSSAAEAKYMKLFPGSTPSPVPSMGIQIGPSSLQLMQDSRLVPGGPWQLVGGNTRLVFSQLRIDVIRDAVSLPGEAELDFCTFCSKLFKSILKEEAIYSNRVAFAPIYAKDNVSNFNSQQFWTQLLKRTPYLSREMKEVNLSYNYVIPKEFGNKNSDVNFKMVLSDAQKNLPSGVVISGCVTIGMDINTTAEAASTANYSEADVEDFFRKVPAWAKDYFTKSIDEE